MRPIGLKVPYNALRRQNFVRVQFHFTLSQPYFWILIN